MKIVSGGLLFTLFVFLDSIELSSQAVFQEPLRIPPNQSIKYYELQNGTLEELIPEHYQHLLYDANYLYGLYLNGILYPVCDADGIRVVRRRSDHQTIRMPPEISQRLGFNNPPWNRRHNSHASSSSNTSERRPTRV